MARFKDYNYDQDKLLPVRFDRQILPGSFEYNLSYLVEHELDLSIFEHRYHNDETGRPAYDPAILLKIIILAYARGVATSRKIEQLCRENVTFMAISADTQPHYTTLADFVSSNSEQIQQLFVQVLLICDAEGLIGRDMFAIDGCKLPGNASKEWSGTRAELSNRSNQTVIPCPLINRYRRSIVTAQEIDDVGTRQEAAQPRRVGTSDGPF